jgi:ribokinase
MTPDSPSSSMMVTLIGDINIDVLMSIPTYPPPGGDAMATGLTLRAGGSVSNTAIVLARFGVQARLIGRTGNDRWADLALALLNECNVDVSAIRRDAAEPTGLIFIPVTPDGERTMFSYRGANVHLPPQEISSELLYGSRILHISGYNFLTNPQRASTWRAIELAQEAGIPISLDVGVEPALRARAEIERLLPYVSILALGMDEARPLFGTVSPDEAAQRALEQGVLAAAIKLGRHGCLLADHNCVFLQSGFPVQVVDTTGAGDAFCAGLLYAYLRRLDLPAAATIANALGALAATMMGGGPVLPGRNQLIHFLREQESLKGEPYLQEALAELEKAA